MHAKARHMSVTPELFWAIWEVEAGECPQVQGPVSLVYKIVNETLPQTR